MKVVTLILALATITTNYAHAASATGNLGLSGSIGDSVALTVTPTANATNLTLTSNAADVNVASVNEVSNAQNGYQILAKSSNAGKLTHSTDSTNFIGYTIKYNGGAAVTLTASDQQVKSVSGGNYNVNSAVTISYTGVSSSTHKSGTYTDTITFTLQSL